MSNSIRDNLPAAPLRTHRHAQLLQPEEKQYRVSFGNGLMLQVMPNGKKYWRKKYSYAGKERILSLGVFPEVGLKAARQKLIEANQQLAKGIDPNLQKRIERATRYTAATNTFEAISLEWLEKEKDSWAPSHIKKQTNLLEKNLTPYIGRFPITEISAPILLDCLRRIEKRGALETARRSRQVAGQVFRYAIITGRATENPAIHLQGALKTPRTRHYPAITDPKPLGQLLRTIEGYRGSCIVETALKLAPLLFVRPGDLRMMRWRDIDLERAEWRFELDKQRQDGLKQHIVPLAQQALDLLSDIRLMTGQFEYVFPGERSRRRPMSDNALNAAMRNLGISKDIQTVHGFRATARTLLDEELHFDIHLIEHQLAHEVRDALGRAYNRTKHLPERKAMMQKWADYLDTLRVQNSQYSHHTTGP